MPMGWPLLRELQVGLLSGGADMIRFEKAEATFPYPFKTPTQDLVVVKQSKAVYDAVSQKCDAS